MYFSIVSIVSSIASLKLNGSLRIVFKILRVINGIFVENLLDDFSFYNKVVSLSMSIWLSIAIEFYFNLGDA